MKFISYIKDKMYIIFSFIIAIMLITMLLVGFKTPLELNIAIFVILSILLVLILLFDYFRKRKFYSDLLYNIDNLEEAYLVLETINEPEFYEGELLCQALYEIDKSMTEIVNGMELQNQNFKEYIEMWIHEIKIPISSLTLMTHNNDKLDAKVAEQIRRIEDYVEQVLYYVRAENAWKDYLIKKVKINKVINSVALKNKDDLLASKIDLIVEKSEESVYTDTKWLEFILNQLISNSIKYRKEDNCYIKIYTQVDDGKVDLVVLDNGIGIEFSDLPKVFDKTFTGKNGRGIAKSTGMGLFIAKNLCTKLGHQIKIESKVNEYTKIIISFSNSDYYDVVK